MLVYFVKVNVSAIGGGSRGPWQALLMSPKGRNASEDGVTSLRSLPS